MTTPFRAFVWPFLSPTVEEQVIAGNMHWPQIRRKADLKRHAFALRRQGRQQALSKLSPRAARG